MDPLPFQAELPSPGTPPMNIQTDETSVSASPVPSDDEAIGAEEALAGQPAPDDAGDAEDDDRRATVDAAAARLQEAGFGVAEMTAAAGRARAELYTGREHAREKLAELNAASEQARVRLERSVDRLATYDRVLGMVQSASDALEDCGGDAMLEEEHRALGESVVAWCRTVRANGVVVDAAQVDVDGLEAEARVVQGVARALAQDDSTPPTCCICYSAPVSEASECGHTFCKACMRRMRAARPPVCFVCKQDCLAPRHIFFS
ncbi:hypothetical protein WJX74_010046 [Apatococcus lobatus]|uniref:RING-type domain-containing protein n=1 Tax=Apatococcus lobatus TaxID=904363 RepID=A0AAW1Q2G9_9CHLO